MVFPLPAMITQNGADGKIVGRRLPIQEILQSDRLLIQRHIPHLDLQAVADSGQCFRMRRDEDGFFCIPAHDQCLMIRAEGGSLFTLDCSAEDYEGHWAKYLDVGTDYQALDALIDPDDLFLQAAAAYSKGLRLLKQDPWEMLVSFIISQRKSIPAIRSCIETLCERFGKPLPGRSIYAFPTAERLSVATVEELNACALGYRSRYILATAQRVAARKAVLHEIGLLPDDQLLNALCLFSGVGVKVAHCVMLFAYGRRAAFPRDVWINRIEKDEYRGRFPEERYPGNAGVFQQYMFYYGRSAAYQEWKAANGGR